MSDREQLIMLIKKLACAKEPFEPKCDEFVIKYDLNTDYDALSQLEHRLFADLSEIADRYSNDPEELSWSNVYFTKEQIQKEAIQILTTLGIPYHEEN